MRKSILTLVAFISLFFFSCGGGSENAADESAAPSESSSGGSEQSEVHGTEVKPGDVKLTSPLNAQWVAEGKATYDVKCQACHKLNDERVVGPGWKDVTKRREPHWIMNMITNVDMISERPLEVSAKGTALQLESIFHLHFDVFAKIFRKTASGWLDITLDNKNSLFYHNRLGRDASNAIFDFELL